VYEAALTEQYVLITTSVLLDELNNVLHRPKFVPALKAANKTAGGILATHHKIAEHVTPIEIAPDAVRDPKDRAVLACAIGGSANCIVSGDKDLLVLSSFQNIPILSASQFITWLAQQSQQTSPER
jgi:putative PIN family toxin of toxin-antitoxin system